MVVPAARELLRAEFLEYVKGRSDNAAVALIAATPGLNMLHALYILSQMACIADLSAALVKGTAREKLPGLLDARFESLTNAFTKPIGAAR